jgi:hypothetical protein
MSVFDDRLPYSQKRLEDLAIALGINTAYLGMSPVTNALSVRESADEKKFSGTDTNSKLLDHSPE